MLRLEPPSTTGRAIAPTSACRLAWPNRVAGQPASTHGWHTNSPTSAGPAITSAAASAGACDLKCCSKADEPARGVAMSGQRPKPIPMDTTRDHASTSPPGEHISVETATSWSSSGSARSAPRRDLGHCCANSSLHPQARCGVQNARRRGSMRMEGASPPAALSTAAVPRPGSTRGRCPPAAERSEEALTPRLSEGSGGLEAVSTWQPTLILAYVE